MTYDIVYAEEAKAAMKNILIYIARDNKERAISYIDEIENAINNLSVFPLLGKRQNAGKNRQIIHGDYKIIYEVKEETIYIKTVKHCALNT